MNKIIYFLKYLKYYTKQKNTYKISFYKCLKAFFNGFTPEEYYLFNFDKNDMNDYLSKFKRIYYRKKLNGPDFTVLLDNKMIFKFISSNKLDISPYLYWKKDNVIYDKDNEIVEAKNIIEKLNGIYFLKPLNEGGGKDGIKITCKNNKYLINETNVNIKEIRKEFETRKSFILEEYVEQAKYSNDIYPNSANTLRIISLKKENSEIVIAKAFHRFGTEKSRPTDNFSRYGLACSIDIETGVLQKCRNKVHNNFFEKHPDTNKQITGIEIPNWENIKKSIIENHNKLNFLNYIAWDILITKKGYVIIEANASCGSDVLQIDEGIKKNKEIYNVYKKMGALK